MDIIFTDTIGVPKEYEPKPAFKMIPEWYKNTESYISDEKKPSGDGNTTGTIKRCMPVFDALNSGYLLETYTDIYVSRKKAEYADKDYYDKTGKTKLLTPAKIKKLKLKENYSWYEWPSYSPIAFHPPEQAPLYPGTTSYNSIPKWINPWGIKTPPGYSSLFLPPLHRDNTFVAMSGVVDTDTYTAPVNIIFMLSDPDFAGLVPAGTPIAQVIPFQREVWQMSIGMQEDLQAQNTVTAKLRSRFFDSYKNQFRQVKEYR